jgi:hypothetical protein
MRNTMSLRHLSHCLPLSLCILLAFLGPARDGPAQKPPPPIKPNPLAPVLGLPAHLGMQRGTTLELTLTGSNLAEPTGLLVTFPAKVTIPTDNKNGQDNAKLRVRLEVPADAPLGYHRLQLATTRGMSNLRLFCIDDLPPVAQAAGNHARTSAQALPIPCVVAGRLDAEASDFYKITVKAGQRLSFDVLGHRLGGPIDPELTIYEAGGPQRELVHANDSPGAQTDCRLSWTFKEAGDYLIEVGDVLKRGGADYWYRLRVGDFPLATVPIPLAIQRGGKAAVRFAGPAVEGVAPVEVTAPTDPAVTTLWVAPRGPSGLHGWPVALAVSDHPEGVEQEPNQEPAQANPINVPGGMTGRFEQGNDTDLYRFSAKKGQRLRIEGHTLELYSPTLLYMVVKNAKGEGELAKSNPQAPPPADQRIDFTPPADGDYLVAVQHLNFVGGPEEAYHLTITPGRADFDLAVGLDRFDVAPGSVVPLVVATNRRGYAGPIALALTGPPGLKGEAVIPAGQPLGTLLLEAAPDLKTGPYLIGITGKATIDGTAVTEYVSVRKAVSDSLAGLPYPPRQLATQIAIAVKQPAPFQLAARVEPDRSAPGLPASLVISVTRGPGFDEAIALGPPEGLPPNVKPPPLKPLAKGQNEVKVPLDMNAKAGLGTYRITLSGKASHQKKEYLAYARPGVLTLTPPFELKVEPAPLSLAQGAKAKAKVAATRVSGFDGEVTVELRNLPAKVTAAKAVIPKGQPAVEIEITAAPDAPAGAKMDVNVVGTAPALGNQQNASANFTVTVLKK